MCVRRVSERSQRPLQLLKRAACDRKLCSLKIARGKFNRDRGRTRARTAAGGVREKRKCGGRDDIVTVRSPGRVGLLTNYFLCRIVVIIKVATIVVVIIFVGNVIADVQRG